MTQNKPTEGKGIKDRTLDIEDVGFDGREMI